MYVDALGTRTANSAAAAYQNQKVQEKAVPAEKTAQDAEAQKAVEQNQDKFVKSTEGKPGTYTKNTLTSKQVDALYAAEEQRTQSFMRMLQSMVAKQGQKSNMTLFGMRLNVTNKDIEAAKASISEGGEYSVDAVAGRIMDMAKALSGGDPSKIGELRTAVQEGFKAAGVELGGKLPDISNQTYDEVMKRFDDWEKESRGATETGAVE